MKRFRSEALLTGLLLSAFLGVSSARAADGPRTVDTLVADMSPVDFFDSGYSAEYRSVSTGRRAVLVLNQISVAGTDPDSVEVTFELHATDGFRASGFGTLVIGTLPPMPGPAAHPFGGVYVLSRLTVTESNRPRSGAWPQPGDELIDAGELHADARFEGAIRIVRN